MSDELQRLQQEVAQTKVDLDKTRTELREYKLWAPLKETAIKAGLASEDWDLVRLDLAERKRVDLDEFGDVVILEHGRPSRLTPERFFSEAYKAERPSLYQKAKTSAAKAENSTPQAASRYTRTIKRVEFDRMNPADRMAYVRTGGGIVD